MVVLRLYTSPRRSPQRLPKTRKKQATQAGRRSSDHAGQKKTQGEQPPREPGSRGTDTHSQQLARPGFGRRLPAQGAPHG